MTQPSTHESRPPPDRKTTLYCPSCEHAAPIDGEWRTVEAEGDRLLVCPRCEAVVDRRPHRERRVLTA